MEKKKSIGGLYRKQTKNGDEFFSGWIELNNQKVKIVVWQNKYKKEDKHPDLTIQEDTYKPEPNLPF